MSLHALGIIVGGLIPALCFTGNGILNKMVTQAGISTGIFLLFAGLGVVLASVPFILGGPSVAITLKGVFLSILLGILWGIGVGLVTVAITVFKASLSALVPIYNLNTLLVVLLSLFLFAEWQHVQVPKLIIGAILVVIGGTLVALA